MAHSISSRKRIRQNEKQRQINRSRRSALRTRLRACRDALVHQDPAAANDAFKLACKALDREADRGLIHRNAAARTKSRLAKRINALASKDNAASA